MVAIRNEKGSVRKLLFIQKSNDEGITFYYMGDVEFLSNKQITKVNGKGKTLPYVAMNFSLHHPIPLDLYEYIEG